ncbi:BTAD domain-containing putative transcriptional regulator [Jidongwangia harbinensis]|uniref:BTAD domain-containing putative transcriptional regulator n=1 Tax=Jidongwangia harbinensis TaxID=2878561 RepID=UPI001CD9472E|nr:BTAD domain-containing putative transcriptional regulator [Jidongwangia harbinensis]MCA2212533.1 tetratricopeptide repeat protein [Jidongwangia harbinensis]
MDVAVLGPVEVRTDTGDPVPVAGARLRTLLTLLALDANRIVSADRLIDGVWGDDPPAGAGNALQALVSRLRRVAPGLVVEAAPAGYRLVIEPDRVDAHRFARLAAEDPATALRLWRGPLEFPDAARASAARLDGLRLAALRGRIAADLRAGRAVEVVAELTELVAAHPLDEPFAALLIRALRDTGSPGRALQVYETTRRRLADTLGTDPSAELAALHLELLRSPKAARGNLPAELSSFVGRDAEVRTVAELIGAHRLVTLTGPGGSGKTRLSVEVGARVPGDVWRVELAPVTDPAEIPAAILTALRLRSRVLVDRPGRGAASEGMEPLTRLCEAVAGREMVLILDNCEHLIGAAARVADQVLRAAPGLRLLATSREPLGLPGERLYPVEPLALPPVDATPRVAAGYPAVRLLVERAGAGLTLDGATAGPVVRICRALDGMPLALELAAARLRTLPVNVLADRLADRFRLLTGGSRTALPRHQTLRAVVDWSWDLLTEPERQLWRRFAVFHGGADVAAVETVCAADLDLLGALVDKSLLTRSGDRYRMLETIREYGLERLAEAGEAESMRRALAGHLLALARTAEPALRGPDQLVWLRRLTAEHDNLHAAVRSAVAAGDTATATALVAWLGWYWWLSGHRSEALALARDVLAMTGPADTDERALAYLFGALHGVEGNVGMDVVTGWFRQAERLAAEGTRPHPALRLIGPAAGMLQGGWDGVNPAGLTVLREDPDPWLRAAAYLMTALIRINFGQPTEIAEAEMRTALAGFRGLGERWGIGFSLSALGDLAAARGDFAQAVAWQREAIALVREVGVREDVPQMQAKAAHQLWMAGDRAEARRLLREAMAGADEVGVPEVTASVLYGQATIAREDGDLDEARARMTAARALFEESHMAPQWRGMVQSTLGLIEAAAGDLATARRLHAEAVELAVSSKDSPVVAMTLAGAADLALRDGDPARAARLLGAAVAVRGSVDRTLPDVDRVERTARAALGDPGFDTCYAEGQSVTVATAMAATGLHPPAERPDGERREHREQRGCPQ